MIFVVCFTFLCMQMEFSFGPQRWLPKESLHERRVDDAGNENENFALGLHAPGFFDKILNVDECLLQSHPANKVCSVMLCLQLQACIVCMQFCVFSIF